MRSSSPAPECCVPHERREPLDVEVEIAALVSPVVLGADVLLAPRAPTGRARRKVEQLSLRLLPSSVHTTSH